MITTVEGCCWKGGGVSAAAADKIADQQRERENGERGVRCEVGGDADGEQNGENLSQLMLPMI